MASILHKLGYVCKGHLIPVTRDDVVGQYIGHAAPRAKESLKKAMGGMWFIDEAYYLDRQENERDYGQKAIEIVLRVTQNQCDDLVVIVFGDASRIDLFFQANPGFRSRILHHVDSPDYGDVELMAIAQSMLTAQNYTFSMAAKSAFGAHIAARWQQPHFANARSICNALDRARLRSANRHFKQTSPVSRDDLMTIDALEVLASRVFDTKKAAEGRKK
jgi:probable Rubsico expression protein CbbX